jgi:peptidyl-prolyl cis-trans isomerase B (cyclophilin B)
VKFLLGLGILFASVPMAIAQIYPTYDYNGVGRPFPVTVKRPARTVGNLEIRILAPVTAAVLGSSPVKVGPNDLAALFPNLWKDKKTTVLYAQLVASNKAVGPALVLQPMTNPPISRLKPDGKTTEFVQDDGNPYAGIRAWVDQDIVFDTTLGQMRFRMRPDCAPNTAWNIMHLVSGGFYRDIIWHRVVALSHGFPFVIQGGDPTGTGDGGPGFAYPLEDSSLPHDFGVISIARDTDPNTNGCQVFVCLSREGTARLDHKYASFGECIQGADTIMKIAAVPVGKEDRPLDPPVIRSAKLVDAAPYGTGLAPVKRPQ